jgi:hypothetical protein
MGRVVDDVGGGTGGVGVAVAAGVLSVIDLDGVAALERLH